MGGKATSRRYAHSMNELSEFKLSLWFTGDELHPRALTQQLGRASAHSVSKGDIYGAACATARLRWITRAAVARTGSRPAK